MGVRPNRETAMHRRAVLSSALAVALGACAPMPRSNPLSRAVARDLRLSSIEVSTTGTAFESRRAAQYSSRLEPDLAATLRQEFAARIEPAAPLRMEVARLNVADSRRTAFGGDQSALAGAVRIVDASGTAVATYAIDVRAGMAAETRTGALVGTAVNSSDRFYRRLLRGFADDARAAITA